MTSRTSSDALERATRLMFTRIMAGLARRVHDQDFTISQVAALHVIDQRGQARVAVLAEELGMSPSAASRMTDTLVQRGLVDRREDPDDRRARTLELTSKGRALVAEIGAERVITMMGVARELPSSVSARLLDMVLRAAARLEKK